MTWQVQEAKQRFSELLRKAHEEGPQAVTRHGEEVAFVIDAAYYHRLTGVTVDFKDWLLHGPKSDDLADILDEIVEERRAGVLPDDGSSIFDEE
ncbi:MAG: type II toxin-antitoxin system Phd/YefM family antitoxin [Actinobacteria bacterium]|nr:type II toxin-antitoxin system Phd/YefM family antitoxin [Actinomycetota bacterium]